MTPRRKRLMLAAAVLGLSATAVALVANAFRSNLPDLFREGKGVVVQGRLQADGVFRADEVLAKHDENHMPPEAADAVERAHQGSARAREALRRP